ncbi:hypothetical protein DM860_014963 [Cuscuta australis]|uniref:Uncharacterized protein n=1 Tax=Cuscuta australis TaxID=267555 RepID=A0A328E3Y3_9ASTE|nr:hypothetical protein DM860_014963 [Cuscuta australis]
MHRQSLGSPGSNHLKSNGVIAGRRESLSAAAVPAAESSPSTFDADEGRKSLKRLSKAERFVHLIPLLTVLCFFILYISSHRPTENDLAQFKGFKPFLKPIESGDIPADLRGVMNMEKGDNVLAVRNLRDLREIGRKSSKNRLHRKIAGF